MSDAEEPAIEVAPRRKREPGPLPDRCGMCRELVMVHERAWERLSSFWGLVIGANYCSDECEDEALHLYPEDVAPEMQDRQAALA